MFIAKNDDLIVLARDTREQLEQDLLFMTYTNIEETDIEYRLYNGEYLTPEEIAIKERDRIDLMTLTPADVERNLYAKFNMDFDDLKELIAEKLTGVDLKALNIEFKASLFYRGAKFGNGRLFDVIGGLLGLTSEELDYLFINKHFPEENEPETIQEEPIIEQSEMIEE